MDLELRSVTEEEFATWSRGIERAFGFQGDEKHIEAWRAMTELDRTLEALSILEAASLVGDERAAELRAEIETGVWART